jgi:hypothetical protein
LKEPGYDRKTMPYPGFSHREKSIWQKEEKTLLAAGEIDHSASG